MLFLQKQKFIKGFGGGGGFGWLQTSGKMFG